LATFVERTLKRSFGAFKNELKKVKLPRRELSFNSLILPWVDKRSSTTDGFNH
jgi:hypothetical protein